MNLLVETVLLLKLLRSYSVSLIQTISEAFKIKIVCLVIRFIYVESGLFTSVRREMKSKPPMNY